MGAILHFLRMKVNIRGHGQTDALEDELGHAGRQASSSASPFRRISCLSFIDRDRLAVDVHGTSPAVCLASPTRLVIDLTRCGVAR